MPWCDGCDRFYNPNSLAPDGTCQQCGAFIASIDDEPEPDERAGRAPWHFYVLLVALVLYLGYRLLQGISWVAHHV